jgi:hypothetical protein
MQRGCETVPVFSFLHPSRQSTACLLVNFLLLLLLLLLRRRRRRRREQKTVRRVDATVIIVTR